jgi:UDP-glucose 4-epimerase
MSVLVTGGLGYIGSHACVALAAAGHDVEILDNLSNAKRSVLARLEELTRRNIAFHQADLREKPGLEKIFKGRAFDSVIHFAGLKAVGESVDKPALYRENNVGGTRNLLDAMARNGVRRIVFSSSATVYGEPERLPIPESHPLRPQSPYGENKVEIERLLEAHAAEERTFRFASLRYFNPIGAHASGRIGEDPRGTPNNLLPFVAQVAVGRQARLRVFGDDYPTADGTGVRDYIHVSDLVDIHHRLLTHLRKTGQSLLLNCGYGRGFSVREVAATVQRISGKHLEIEEAPRRPGDLASVVADNGRLSKHLGWKPKYDDLDVIVTTALEWERRLKKEMDQPNAAAR